MKLVEKTTLVLGASEKSDRYSNKAIKMLNSKGIKVIPVSHRDGQVEGIKFVKFSQVKERVHTVSIYLNPENQVSYYDDILKLKPKRIIFNPETENMTLENLAQAEGIDVMEACTLVLLSTGQY